MQEVAGVNGAGTIWRSIMDAFHQGRPIQQFARPAGISAATICADTGSLAGEACPNRMEEQFIAGTEPKTSDVFFKTVKVAGDGDCLAASYTPAAQAYEKTFAVYPAEFHDYAVGAGIPQPPTRYCPPPQGQPDASIALISQPAAGIAITTTQVLVRGSARGAYTIEWGGGRDPSEWQQFARGDAAVADGILGVWRNEALPPGDYTLRLRVTTPDGVPVEAKTTIYISR
jgi:hypothetical protein